MNSSDLEDVSVRWAAAMKRGDFEAAWRQTDRIETERRALEATGGFTRQPYHLSWNGTPFDDRRVLVRCTHGLGDTLQFVRYVPLIRERARSVSLLVQPHLLELFEGSTEFGEVHDGWTDETPPHDVEIEIMELPYAFRSTVGSLPNRVPYLPQQSLRRYASRLRQLNDRAFNIGLLWAASEWDATRSISLDTLAPLADASGAKFYSLQQGEPREAWASAPFELEPLHLHTEEIAAAAAAMQKLDLMITVDGMAAHLAGGLARPVWALLRHDSDWRWMSDRPDSPWYPTMRLFRQPTSGDWDAVAMRVASELAASCEARRIKGPAASLCR